MGKIKSLCIAAFTLGICAIALAQVYNAQKIAGFPQGLAANTTNAALTASLNISLYDDVSLIATGNLSGSGTSAILLTGYPSLDGTTIIGSNAIVTWTISPIGTLTFSAWTNIPQTSVGSVGYILFKALGNGNTTILSNFGIAYAMKPRHQGFN